MLTDGICTAVAVQFTSVSHRYVIVHLEVLYAIITDQPVHYITAVFPYFRIAEIQHVTFVVNVAFSMAADKPVIRKFICKLTGNSHNFDFQPESHFQAFAVCVIADFFQASRESSGCFLPFTDTVPPESVVIPSCIQTVIFASQLCRLVNDGKLPLCCGISHQAVHVIIKYHVQFLIVRIRSAYFSTISGQRCYCRIQTSFYNGCPCRNSCEAFSRFQILIPSMLLLCGTAYSKIQIPTLGGTIFYQPLSGTFNLENISFPCFSVFGNSHWKILAGRPGSLSTVTITVQSISLMIKSVYDHSV